MISYTLPGYFTQTEAQGIKEALEGKTFLNLHVEYTLFTCNSTVTLYPTNKNYTSVDYSDEQFKEDIIWILASALAKKHN